MLSTLPVFHRGRSAERVALACCALCTALALWLLVRLVWSLVPRGDAAYGTALRAGAEAAGAAPMQSIAKWHLFGNTPYRPGAAGGNSSAATSSLILRGTLAASEPRSGFALIAAPPDDERAYKVGDQVAAGARLVAVYPDHVVLAHGGNEETLKLPRDDNLAPADIVRPTPATVTSRQPARTGNAARASNAAPATSAAAAGNWQQTVAHLRQNPDELMRRVQIVPVLDGGKLTGVRVSTGADTALIRQIGLRPGDIVTAVNGLPIDSYARGQEIMSSLKNSSSVHVTVLRDGKPTALTVGLQ